tara:strand:+ start:931 stop:1095 length:165 start_codon:yes stop_codon:yes gene_type:complete
MKELENPYGQVFWDSDRQVYYFWNEDDVPVGFWSTKDEAALAYEEYIADLNKGR